jgi:hypothetical protein
VVLVIVQGLRGHVRTLKILLDPPPLGKRNGLAPPWGKHDEDISVCDGAYYGVRAGWKW